MDPLNTKKTVGTDAVIISQSKEGLNYKRRAIILTNTGATNITLNIGGVAVANEGIVLYPGGSFDRNPEQSPPQEQITAISDAAGGVLSQYEEVY